MASMCKMDRRGRWRCKGGWLVAGLVASLVAGCAYDDRNQPDPLLGGRPVTPAPATTAGVYPGTTAPATPAGGYAGTPSTMTASTLPPIPVPHSQGGTVMLTNTSTPIRDNNPDLRIPAPPGTGPTTGGVLVSNPSPLVPGSPSPGITVSPPTPPSPPPMTGALTVSVPGPTHSFEEVWARLQSQGMVESQFEGGQQAGYTFTGRFVYPQQPDKLKTIVGNGPTLLDAMQVVADQAGR